MAHWHPGSAFKLPNFDQRQQWASRHLKSERSNAQVTIFLSHSHADRDIVYAFIQYLASFGINIYVDWQDSEMPRVTSVETARRIKDQIAANKLFMVFYTLNSKNSRWVPWELGVADQIKGYDYTYIVPVADDQQGQFNELEYLRIYKRIEFADTNTLAAFEPGRKEGGTLLSDVFRRYST